MKYKLELSAEHLQIIGNALADYPYKLSAPVIVELQKQVNEQDELRKKEPEDSA